MDFEFMVAYPSDREGRVVELVIRHGTDSISIPADIYREEGETRITVWSLDGEVAWEFPVDVLRAAIDHAVAMLDTPPGELFETP